MISNGIDLVKINRFESLKNNNSFMNKTFTEKELKYINFRDNTTSTIAGLYASKEAFLKALKKGLDYCPLKDIEILHDNNSPYIVFHNDSSVKNISLSISHDGDYAVAIVSMFI